MPARTRSTIKLGQLAKTHLVSRTTIHRVLGEQIPAVTKGLEKPAA
jgi:hypothetical protein